MVSAQQDYPKVLLEEVVEIFDKFIGRIGEHAFATESEIYQQPYAYLSFHLIQMHVAGWTDVDFDTLTAVSGASALFGYQPGEFMPKYAHLSVGADQRIADAIGFGYEWMSFDSIEDAWDIIKHSVDAGKPVKGWDWENILFAGYRDAEQPEDRQLYALADGPGTYSKWLTWAEFTEWYERVKGWGAAAFGRHTERVAMKPANEVARQVIQDLIAWSVEPPQAVRDRFSKATFGLDGIEVYAAMCADTEAYEDVVACHDINPQWTTRNSTAVYLKRVAEAGLFFEAVNVHLLIASEQYRAAYECWQAYYKLLGHRATESTRNVKARRLAGAAVVRAWLAHEKVAIAELERVLVSL